jgi:flagellar biosynthesis anti-sigma factor FlgM
MVIKKVAPYTDRKAIKTKEADLETVEPKKARSAVGALSGKIPDRVELSKGYQEIDKLKKAIGEMSEVRADEVEHFRQLVENDQYSVDPAKVAAGIMDELIL